MSTNEITLSPALTGSRIDIATEAGRVSYYTDAPDNVNTDKQAPILLIHTVNAAAGAHEIKPLYNYYRTQRPVYALDLPGYGFSERSDRDYTPRLMTDAIHYVCDEIKQRHHVDSLHALAVSLSTEFLARAAFEKPDGFKSISLVSPTGFNKAYPIHGLPESNKGMNGFLKLLKKPYFGPPIFRLLISRKSIRFFLQKTWGSKQIDEMMYDYACETTRQPGAEFAPFYFLSGFLFSRDINRIYESLSLPVWMSHGVRGDFTNYIWKDNLSNKDNWEFDVFQTGALPYFEVKDAFMNRYNEFISKTEN